MPDSIGEILITEEQIRARAAELGAQITEDYRGHDLIVVGTLNGAILWMADLVKNIHIDIRLDFISAHSYGSGTESSGHVSITKDMDFDIEGRDLLFVEDIIDSGKTMQTVMELYRQRGPRSIRVCTMLDKPARRVNDFKADYVGFVVDDLFIVGYGLDYDQKYRNLPYISWLKDGAAK